MIDTVIVQARMGSNRFPGKVLKPLRGKPVLKHVIERCLLANNIERVIVAIPMEQEWAILSDAILEWKKERNGIDVAYSVANESDLIGRYLGAMKRFDVEQAVRVCGDSPFILPESIAFLCHQFERRQPSERPPTHGAYIMPSGRLAIYEGMGVPEIVVRERLRERHRQLWQQLEHPTTLIEHGKPYLVEWPFGQAHAVVDTPEDLERLENQYDGILSALQG